MKERFDNLDGLRAISCLCIIAMHIKANTEYSLHPFLTSIVSSWTHFVPLFLIISGFGMFCGYYNRFKNGEVNLNLFYTKRYKKLLPFFITLIVIDLLINRSFSHVIEGITEATLVFGLLPNNQLDVIGVSWTLGVIFLFYMLFPFVVYLCWTKKRTLITLVISIVLCFFCSFYFFSEKFVIDDFSGKRNFLYCSPYFIAGGALYIYKDLFFSFIRRYRYVWLLLCICLSVGWYFIPSNIMIKNLILFTFWLMYAVSVKSFLLSNKVSKYLSKISLELYLAQMVIFRLFEKAKLLYLFGSGWVSFVFVWIITIVGLVLFIEFWKMMYKWLCNVSNAVNVKYKLRKNANKSI